MSKQRQFINVKSTTKFNAETTLILGSLKKQTCSYITILEKLKSLYSVEMITVFQRRNNINLPTLNQRQNLTLKQR